MLSIRLQPNFKKSFGDRRLMFKLKMNCSPVKLRLEFGFYRFMGALVGVANFKTNLLYV